MLDNPYPEDTLDSEPGLYDYNHLDHFHIDDGTGLVDSPLQLENEEQQQQQQFTLVTMSESLLTEGPGACEADFSLDLVDPALLEYPESPGEKKESNFHPGLLSEVVRDREEPLESNSHDNPNSLNMAKPPAWHMHLPSSVPVTRAPGVLRIGEMVLDALVDLPAQGSFTQHAQTAAAEVSTEQRNWPVPASRPLICNSSQPEEASAPTTAGTRRQQNSSQAYNQANTSNQAWWRAFIHMFVTHPDPARRLPASVCTAAAQEALLTIATRNLPTAKGVPGAGHSVWKSVVHALKAIVECLSCLPLYFPCQVSLFFFFFFLLAPQSLLPIRVLITLFLLHFYYSFLCFFSCFLLFSPFAPITFALSYIAPVYSNVLFYFLLLLFSSFLLFPFSTHLLSFLLACFLAFLLFFFFFF